MINLIFYKLWDLLFLRIIGSHDQTISVWTFNASYMETFSSYKHEIGDVVRLDRVIRHHKSPLTSLSYDGINSIISADCQGYIFEKVYLRFSIRNFQ